MTIDSFILEYYIPDNEIIFPSESVCSLLNKILEKGNRNIYKKQVDIYKNKKNERFDKSCDKPEKNCTQYKSIANNIKKDDLLTILNTLSHLNFEKNQQKFDCFQDKWTKENTTTFISFIVNQRLHSKLYVNILSNYKPGIICTIIEKLIYISNDLKEKLLNQKIDSFQINNEMFSYKKIDNHLFLINKI